MARAAPPFVAAWIAVWTPAMLGAVYSWRNGGYYDYGWFIPPAAIWLLLRRWIANPPPRGGGIGGLPLSMLLVVPWFLVLRVLCHADPGWRMPVGLLALTAIVVGHWILARAGGWPFSTSFWKITLLLASAIPWPSAVETGIVHWLTAHVVEIAAELFRWAGRPVEIMGERLALRGTVVEVTDGCSGVRSFQTYLMATWFFAELQRLSVSRTFLLLGWGLAVAFAVNVARTCVLAHIRFVHGPEAFSRAHDLAGMLAFTISACVFFIISERLGNAKRRSVRRMSGESAATPPPQIQ